MNLRQKNKEEFEKWMINEFSRSVFTYGNSGIIYYKGVDDKTLIERFVDWIKAIIKNTNDPTPDTSRSSKRHS